jgi:hypothetical protein
LFTALGFEVRSVLDGGYQGHWDYDVEYDVLCSVPKCLPSISPPSV